MVVLRKIKASTLMETLVATVLIIIIFILASFILNNVFSNTIKHKTRSVDAYLNELQYLYDNEKLELPHQETIDDWEIIVDEYAEGNVTIIEFEANNTKTNKVILKQRIETKK